MLRYYISIIIILLTVSVQAQISGKPAGVDRGFNTQLNDSIKNKYVNVTLSGKTHYTDYKVISFHKDTTYIDTTLSIHKDYTFNYLRTDTFELLPFQNQGQTYNNLGYDFSEVALLPKLGARAKHFNYYEIEDIDYYQVPTPTSELYYRTGMEQGQVLDALFTFNTSRRKNFSIAFKGLRSLGKYRNSLSSHGNMRITYSYATKNNAYNFRSHIVAQDLINNENNGLTAQSIINFESGDPNFTDRGRLETNFSDASNVLRGNRYYIDHDYKIWQYKDTVTKKTSYLKVGHILSYERKHYEYRQSSSNSLLGDSFSAVIDDKLTYVTTDNQAYIALKSPIVLGEVKFRANYFDYNYGYQSAAFINEQLIPSHLKGNTISVGGDWKTQLKGFNLNASTATILTGDLIGNYFKGSAEYKKDSLFLFKGTFLTNSKSPNFNFLLNQSNYISYNWFNDLKNERTRGLLFELASDKILNASVQLTQIDNYTYLSDTTAIQTRPTPLQAENTINYLKVKVSKEFKVGKFALNNTVMYQNVSQGSSVFRVPELVTRNTLYFSDFLFKGDPLYLQTGVTLNYFTEYLANSYNPLLAEFHLQNEQKIGGYPVLDFFINAQIKRTRLYLKAEHFNANFSTPNYYTAPTHPYRDFVIRFGIVWNFFI